MTVELVAAVSAHGVKAGTPVALVVTPLGAVLALGGAGGEWHVPAVEAAAALRAIDDALRPRWVWWSAREAV